MLLALAGAWFGFANPWLHFPAAIFLLPAALLLSAQKATSSGQAFRHGFIIALPGYSASLYWLAIPVHDFGGLPWALALPCPVLVGAVLAIYAGIFCLGIFSLGTKTNSFLTALFAGVFWATLELIRNYLLTGFPWLTLSSALGPWPWALGLAGWCGAFGLSGVLVSMTCLALRPSKGSCISLAVMTLLVLLPGLYTTSTPPTGTASITLIQGNIDQDQKWEAAMQRSILESYNELSRNALHLQPTELVIWPETALPFYYQDENDLTFALQNSIVRLHTPLLVGAPAYSSTHGLEEAPYVLHNRAYLIDSRGQALSWYDKEHLVPFGEYVPLGKWLPFLAKLVPGEYEFRPSVHTAPLSLQDMSMGVLTCYEAIFPELAQARVAQGANLLINISNDAWFGHSSAPLQHLHLAVLRAVEQNRSLVRGTNTGISAFISPTGKILSQTDIFVPATLYSEDVQLLTKTSFFHDHFYFIHMVFPLLSAGVLATCLTIRRRPLQ